eukprot:scaffold68_cov340-Pavlova_lutheri.AAC.8
MPRQPANTKIKDQANSVLEHPTLCTKSSNLFVGEGLHEKFRVVEGSSTSHMRNPHMYIFKVHQMFPSIKL